MNTEEERKDRLAVGSARLADALSTYIRHEFKHLSVGKNIHGIIILSYGLLLMQSPIDNVLNTLYNTLHSSDV